MVNNTSKNRKSSKQEFASKSAAPELSKEEYQDIFNESSLAKKWDRRARLGAASTIMLCLTTVGLLMDNNFIAAATIFVPVLLGTGFVAHAENKRAEAVRLIKTFK